MGDMDKSIAAFKASLDSGELPTNTAQNIRLSLASSYFSSRKNKQALAMFVKWYEGENKPIPDALVFGANLYVANQEYNKAIPLINSAIILSPNPKETWFRILSAIYMEMEDYVNASKVLGTLIRKNPKNVLYWKQLSASNYYSGDEKGALSVMLLAHEKLLFTTEKELLDLVKLAASKNIPIRASLILEKGLKEGLINTSSRNMELLGNIYIQAKEHNKAIESFRRAADLINSPKLYLKVANLYSDSHQWASALDVLDKHFPKEQALKDRGMLLKGIALFETGKPEEAKEIFRKVSSHREETAKQASMC